MSEIKRVTVEREGGERVELDPAVLLIELHRNAAPLGMGILADRARKGRPLSYDEAMAHVERARVFIFDYVEGRPIKVAARVDNIICVDGGRFYNRDNGPRAFERAVDEAVRREGAKWNA